MKELSFSQQRLLEAITNCRIYQTRQLLEAGTPAEFIDQEGYSPLLRACFIDEQRHRTRTNLIKLLILYGADVNTTDPQGRHALTYACMTENQAMIQLLLDTSIHNIDLNMKDIDGDTPLIHAVRLGNVQIVKVLVDAMIKFGINMDVRNNADRTPYLEAKRLGQMECAEILLKKGNASRDVQVNPFLELLGNEEDQYQYRADVRGVDWDRKTMNWGIKQERDKKHSQHQGKCEKLKAKRDIKILSTNKRLPKRQCRKPRALRDTNPEKNPVVVGERKLRSHTTQNTCVTDVLREIQVTNEIEPDGVSEMSNDVIKDKNVAVERLSVISKSPFAHVRPSTAVTTKRELKDVRNRENRHPLIYNTFLTDGTSVRPASHRVFTPRHPRSKTAPPRRFDFTGRKISSSTEGNQTKRCSFDDSDEVSWYSHFSICTSPSVNFMNKIMTMYAEQVSPESSYRRGVKPRKTEDAPTIVAPPDIEHDKRSDGRRSSSGSVRSQSGSGRNRRFSVISKTVASYISSKKALATNKPKS